MFENLSNNKDCVAKVEVKGPKKKLKILELRFMEETDGDSILHDQVSEYV